MSAKKFTKREQILRLRAVETVIQDIIDDLTDDLEEVESLLRDRGETPAREDDAEEEE